MKTVSPFDQITSLVASIREGKIHPVYLFSGEEDYFIFKARQMVSNALLKLKHGDQSELVDGANISITDLIANLNSPSLFDPFRVLVVRNAPFFQSKPNVYDEKKFISWLEQSVKHPGNIPAALICTAQKIDKRLGLVKRIKKHGVILTFETPPGYVRGDTAKDPYYFYIQRLLKSTGKNISAEAWMQLRQRVPNTLWAIVNAVEILIAYTGEKKGIDKTDVETLIAPGADLPVFAVTEALGNKDVEKLRESLAGLLNSGTSPLIINKLLSSRIRVLLLSKAILASGKVPSGIPQMEFWRFRNNVIPLIKELFKNDPELDALLGQLHPYVLYKGLQQAATFSERKLNQCAIELAGIDMALKSSVKSPLIMLELALIPLCY